MVITQDFCSPYPTGQIEGDKLALWNEIMAARITIPCFNRQERDRILILYLKLIRLTILSQAFQTIHPFNLTTKKYLIILDMVIFH